MSKQASNVYIYDCVWFPPISKESETPSMVDQLSTETVRQAFLQVAKKFIFQLEQCPKTKRYHYQCFINLKEKVRPAALGKLLSGLGLGGITCRPCSNAGKAALQQYCMKSDSRKMGPWADHKIYMGEDLIQDLRPWQQKIKDMIQRKPDARTIHWFFDSEGGAGKSSFAKYMYFHHKILTLTFGDAKDLLYVTAREKNLDAYMFDLSRTKSAKTSMSDIYAALESIKNGYFISTKYETEVVCMATPHIIVFANCKPDFAAMSSDRWKVVDMSLLGVHEKLSRKRKRAWDDFTYDSDEITDVEDEILTENIGRKGRAVTL